MGFTYCISVNLGPFRVNLSKFSLGHSVGGRGFCVGTTAREKKYCLTRSRRALPVGLLSSRLPSVAAQPPGSSFSIPWSGVGCRKSGAGCLVLIAGIPAAIAIDRRLVLT